MLGICGAREDEDEPIWVTSSAVARIADLAEGGGIDQGEIFFVRVGKMGAGSAGAVIGRQKRRGRRGAVCDKSAGSVSMGASEGRIILRMDGPG